LLAGLARGTTVAAPVGSVIYEHVTSTGRWLESRDLTGGSRFALTRPLRPGELRRDCCATWLGDGSRVAFVRHTPTENAIYAVDADGTQLRRIVSETQLAHRAGIHPELRSLEAVPDGSKLLFTLDDSRSCNGDSIWRVNSDGSDLRRLYRRPASEKAELFVYDWSPDKQSALFEVSHNDGDCYGSHIEESEIELVGDDGAAPPRRLATTNPIEGAGWLPSGHTIILDVCPEDGRATSRPSRTAEGTCAGSRTSRRSPTRSAASTRCTWRRLTAQTS